MVGIETMSDAAKKNRLKDFKVDEVSLVDRGANGLKFYCVKSATGGTLMAIHFDEILKKQDEKIDALRKTLAEKKVSAEAIDHIDAGLRVIKEAGDLDDETTKIVAEQLGVKPVTDPDPPKPLATIDEVIAVATPELKDEIEKRLADKRSEIDKALDGVPEAVRKELADVRKALDDERDKRIDVEVSAIVKSLDKAPIAGDDMKAILKAAYADKPKFDALRSMFDRVHKAISDSKIDKALGDGGDESETGGSAITKAAQSWAKETGYKGSDADALDAFIRTEKGREIVRKNRS